MYPITKKSHHRTRKPANAQQNIHTTKKGGLFLDERKPRMLGHRKKKPPHFFFSPAAAWGGSLANVNPNHS